jgi:hypothetical protein
MAASNTPSSAYRDSVPSPGRGAGYHNSTNKVERLSTGSACRPS